MNQLPSGWAKTKIGELCDLVNGRAFKPADWGSSGLPIVRIQNLDRSDAKFNFFSGLVQEKFLIQTGDLLFAWSGTPGTSFGCHIWNGPNAILNQHIFNVHYNRQVVDKHFFGHAINQTLDEQIAKAHGGVGLRHVTKGKFEDTNIPLPPLREQRRIVAKIDGLSANSKRARENLDHIPRLVEKYKQAILAAAFSGELTSEWRPLDAKAGIVDHHQSTQIDARASSLPDLPISWRWKAISEVMGISGGLTKNPERTAMAIRRPYLRVANVYANELRLAEISETGCTEKEFEKTKLVPGDLLIVEGNGSLEQIGRVAIWNDEVKDCSHQNHIIRARPSEMVEPRYALFWLLSPAGRDSIEAVASSSSGLHTLSITKVGGLPIPLCAKSEQRAIIRLIEKAFAWIERLASETTSARKLTDHLDQAILAKAFRGELVPQDPNDEPAGVLLERIRTERNSETSSKRTTRRKA